MAQTDTSTNGLKPEGVRFVESLLAGTSVADAAREVGISTRTGYRWVADPSVREALDEGVAELRQASLARLTALSNAAIDVVEKRIRDGDGKTALSVLRGLGILGRRPAPRPQDPYSEGGWGPP